MTGAVVYTFVPKKKVRKHVSVLNELLGGEEGDTCLVCRCGWTMRFEKEVRIDEAEVVFLDHIVPADR